MSKIKIVKDNVLLSIEEEELAQYEARGYSKLGATKKVASKDLEKDKEYYQLALQEGYLEAQKELDKLEVEK